MAMGERTVLLAAGLRTPFVGVDGPFADRDSLALSVPVVQAMAPVCTENLNPHIMVMKSAKDRVCIDRSDPLNGARDRRIFIQ